VPERSSIFTFNEEGEIMKDIVTQWFYGKPLKRGVWETKYVDEQNPTKESEKVYQYWDGRKWGRCMGTPDDAYRFQNYPSFLWNDICYRGLAYDPFCYLLGDE
jgi:hypothetical protein